MEIYQVDPNKIRLREIPTERDIRKQKERLLKEGQIEPITVNGPDLFIPHEAWLYSEAQVIAAIQLEWPTLLVTY